jgi:hypothetical protein
VGLTQSLRRRCLQSLCRTMPWKLWFINLSGWTVFLIVVVAVSASMLALSVGMAWLSSNRAVAQNAIVAAVAVAVIMGGLMVLLAVLARLAF